MKYTQFTIPQKIHHTHKVQERLYFNNLFFCCTDSSSSATYFFRLLETQGVRHQLVTSMLTFWLTIYLPSSAACQKPSGILVSLQIMSTRCQVRLASSKLIFPELAGNANLVSFVLSRRETGWCWHSCCCCSELLCTSTELLIKTLNFTALTLSLTGLSILHVTTLD